MANVAISGDTSGAITLTVPATAGTQTVTFPAATGTAMVSGNMPAFSVFHQGGNQSVSNATYTKIAFNSESFDTNNNFDSTTNYRFTPTVAGYYYINLQVEDATGFSTGYQYAVIYKNGSAVSSALFTASAYGLSCSVNTLLYCNGSTDYIEGYYYQASGSSSAIDQIAKNTFMVGSLVRGA